MQQRCAKHVFEEAEDVCRTCGGHFCDECLVYASGPKKPPLCIQCAVAAASIRAAAGAKRSRPALRRLRLAWVKKVTPDPAPAPSLAQLPEVRLSTNR